jgi:hypothetical protein
LVKQCHFYHPQFHHCYRWYVYHSQSWVVYDMALPTLYGYEFSRNFTNIHRGAPGTLTKLWKIARDR